MIALTELNGERLYLNPDLIETFKETPGLVIVLVDGKRLRVKENAADVVSAITAWRAAIIAVSAQISRPAPPAPPAPVSPDAATTGPTAAGE